MTVPTYDKIIEPVLRYLALHPDGATTGAVCAAVADNLALSDADRAQLLPSGTQAIYKNRTGWAHDRLKRAGLSASPRRGFWQLTGKGFEYFRAHPGPLTSAEAEYLANANAGVRLRPESLEDDTEDKPLPSVSSTTAVLVASPDDRLELALSELREAAAEELLEAIAGSISNVFRGPGSRSTSCHRGTQGWYPFRAHFRALVMPPLASGVDGPRANRWRALFRTRRTPDVHLDAKGRMLPHNSFPVGSLFSHNCLHIGIRPTLVRASTIAH